MAVVFKNNNNLTKPKDPPKHVSKPQLPATTGGDWRQQQHKKRCDCNARLTLRLKPATYKNLKVIGLKTDTSLNETINRLLNLVINNRQLLEKYIEANMPAGNAPRIIYFDGD